VEASSGRRLDPLGTALHDRFLLPHFVFRDLKDVLDKLRKAGYSFEDGWYASHFEFRFPKIGTFGRTAWKWNCAGHWNPGMCSQKRQLQEERCARSTLLSSEFR